ncbi:diguanylate cyclase (GGDEF)-like protein/PAS domain S-box-containing protein [Catenuloplanes nepalensis]|uniref:Diguanylate cyclase (GGDEF)-like protein/PAS domain S-box-containing protein n=1 Tax=Catenuloplanes nepalensis TaxID=587533 RepID=A0ABT9MRV9_9ACTN|nr:GGDEF domain-containing protein [Catenuloplanes nepalensis]MDP9794145.1 diguanylate cyclase (GGDEF)-like protein/PAS domain S-box-containing protein [Catenuloplanes nepalensis]
MGTDVAHETGTAEAERDTVLAAALAGHPDGHFFAFGANGLFVPMPASVELGGHRVVEGARSALDLVVPGEQQTVTAAWYRMLAEGAASCQVHPLSSPDQQVTLTFVNVTHRHGVYLGFVTGIRGDIGSAVLAHEPIKPRMITVRKDATARFVAADPGIEQLLGWAPADLLETRSLDLVHPDDRDRAIASWLDLMSAPPGAARRVRLRHLHRDGSVVWFDVTNYRHLDDPDQPHVVAEMLDISDEMAMHEALRANEQLLRRLTESLPLSVLQIDAERRVVYQNQRLTNAIGARIGQQLDDSHLASTLPADRPTVDDAITAVLTGADDRDIEYSYRHATAGVRRISASLRALTSDTGVVTGAIICLSDITEDSRLREELKHQATYDPLTACLNRASTLAALQESLHRHAGAGVAVMFIDLNAFKDVNDRLGHAAGDHLLAFVAGRLRRAVRDTDVVGRFGGDEFVVVCAPVAGPDRARLIAENLVAALDDATLETGGDVLRPAASIGVAWAPTGATTAEALIARADAAMYEAKRARTGRTTMALAATER